MKKTNSKILYEKFHKITKEHSSLVKLEDYTHGPILKILEKYITRNFKSILNIGCGTGSIDFYLENKGHNVVGIDISERAINSARQNAVNFNLNNIHFERTTLEDYKTTDRFDAILLIEVLEHLEDDRKAILKIYGLLKKNGLLVLSTPSLNAPLYRLGLLKGFDKRVGHLRRYKAEIIIRLIERQGFEMIELIKTEGILRNFIFTIPLGTYLLKLINRSATLAKIVSYLDNIALALFGESDLIIVARKT